MTIEQQLESALRRAQQSNARRINRLRAVGVGAFTVIIATMAHGFNKAEWLPELTPITAYFVIALVLMIGSEANPQILQASRFAIPIVDMPMVFATQFINIITSLPISAGHISEFSVSLFVLLLMLSALTLNSAQIYLSLGVAIVLQQILHHAAEVDLDGRVLSPIVFGLATWICIFAGQNRLRLVESITYADARRRRLQRYFSPGVGEMLEEHEEDDLALGQECVLTVLFTDLRGFTALSEKLTGRQVITLLNAFHTRMVEAVFRHGGTLDKYLGDGLMAYFNSPVAQSDHAARAVRCALAMQSGLAALNTERSWHGKRELKVGIGVHTGPAIVGDLGAPHRREFTAIGEAVNIASRLEEMTKEVGMGVLVSNATAELASTQFLWTKLGVYPVRGCTEPLELFTPGEQR